MYVFWVYCMASHFKWYPSSDETVVPWNARYQFPSQSNKAEKMTPRIPPKNGSIFSPGQTIRVEFPAQGYVNPLNTTLEFDVTLTGYGTPADSNVRFQNAIASIYSRVRLLYGASPLEDVIKYDQIVRSLTEWTSTNSGVVDQTSIAEGVGGLVVDMAGLTAGGAPVFGLCNVRQKYIQGMGNAGPAANNATSNFSGGCEFAHVGDTSQIVSGLTPSVTRRYQINFALGLFTQDKLIPTKFMASQLAIELTLADSASCIFAVKNSASGSTPNYAVSNVNLIPEILQFDASYDSMFLRGLREGGVPIKFSSWHTYIFSSASSSNVSLQIQERSRSVKAIFAVQKRPTADYINDNGATFLDTSENGASTLQTYQYRIGARYFPASPVQLSQVGGAICNGGAEAYVELSKALNIVGDYRLSSSCSVKSWAVQPSSIGQLPETDGWFSVSGFDSSGRPLVHDVFESSANSFSGGMPSSCFAAAINLETTNGIEISGLNAEEQSDISLLMNWKSPQKTGGALTPSNIEVYTYYDAMIILRENNVLELIQ